MDMTNRDTFRARGVKIKELKKQVEELKKENTELQRELSVHNFLDTGVPQERLDYQRELKKEIIRLKSLCRRAADEIRDLDNIIIDFVEGNAFPQKNEDDLWAGEASINLLNRLDGKTNGGYIENYDDLHLEMKTLDGYAQIEHPDFYQKQEHSPECKWHKDWHACDCGAFDDGGNTTERVEEQIEWLKKVAAQKVAEQHKEAFEKLAEEEERELSQQAVVKEGVTSIKEKIREATETSILDIDSDEVVFLRVERERLIKKLEKIENLSRYAWELVYSNPQEAKEVFKMINTESKYSGILISHLRHQLQVHEWPPYSTCPSCSWLKRERGIEACEEHSK